MNEVRERRDAPAPAPARDSWLTDLFGYPVYRLSGAPDGAEAGRPWHAGLEQTGRLFAYARVPTGDVRRVHRLCDQGFRVVDVSLKFRRAPTTMPGAPITVREATAADFADVVRIAGSAFRFSRFHLDPRVPPALADRIKAEWMGSYGRGTRGVGCLVAVQDGTLLGFLGIVENRSEGVVRIIDLVAVDAFAQGRGVGRALVNHFITKSCGVASVVEVGTQAANTPSVRLYEQCGFQLAGSEYVLHAHLQNGTPA